ncbi:MAG: Asp-tRNA(Asn)/Glu-tRNA(Gln) amidotransferase subunit GatC [Bacteroidota bacterium]|nr:Asp-tRNA(Asn)/Glu-tRNA(Gln) amidotransferase subunit GatC [Bacteroidota bacterium]
MSDLTFEKIDELAALARLSFEKDEKKAIQKDLQKILSFCETLTQVDTEGLEPLIYLNENEIPLRKDIPKNTLKKSEALNIAPLADSDYVKVPKVK